METLRNPKVTTATGKNVQKFQNHLVTPENSETAVCGLSGLQYHVSECLGEVLIPCFMAVIFHRCLISGTVY